MTAKESALLQHLSTAFANIPFNRMLGLQLNHLSTDHAIVSFNNKDELIGNFLHGILHGGVISSVLDMTGGMVVMANTIDKHQDSTSEELTKIIGKCSTIDLQTSFIAPGKGDAFIAKAWLVKSGHHISFTRMELHNQNESLIATASGTYLCK